MNNEQSIAPQVKLTPNRRARMSSGLTGITVDFDLVHLQHISIKRDEIATMLSKELEPAKAMELLSDLHLILDFIVQQDVPNPFTKGLFAINSDNSLNVSKTSYR